MGSALLLTVDCAPAAHPNNNTTDRNENTVEGRIVHPAPDGVTFDQPYCICSASGFFLYPRSSRKGKSVCGLTFVVAGRKIFRTRRIVDTSIVTRVRGYGRRARDGWDVALRSLRNGCRHRRAAQVWRADSSSGTTFSRTDCVVGASRRTGDSRT